MTSKIFRAVKLGVAGAAGIAALALAAPAMAQVNDGSSGDGDLFLIVYDSTAGVSYVEDLGLTSAAVASDSKVDSAAAAATGGHLSTALPGYSATFAADSTLSSYLAAHSTDTFQWEVVADSTVSTNTVATSFLLTTASKPISSTFTDSSGGGMSGAGGTVDTNALNLQGDIGNWNANGAFTTKNSVNPPRSAALTAFSNLGVFPGGSTDKGALTWYGNGNTTPAVTFVPTSGSSVSNFYLASDAVTNSANPQALAAIFNLGTVTFSSNGTLTFAGGSPVPLPAAVWLFGSGLLGLAGVARRRRVAA
jgi:hypothetical protein